jgi:hypothetical protein
MGVVYANNVESTIAVGISSSDGVLQLAPGTGSLFPILASGDYFFATLTSIIGTVEIVRCTARVGDNLTVVRGVDGTSATSFPANSRIEMRVNAAAIRALLEDNDFLVL